MFVTHSDFYVHSEHIREKFKSTGEFFTGMLYQTSNALWRESLYPEGMLLTIVFEGDTTAALPMSSDEFGNYIQKTAEIQFVYTSNLVLL